ncbi:MAG: biotin transporter BioY [Lachnospiraceae bacterium]|nr:biotin transporter BioY [Lachnospiraceae bacterium]
MEASMNEKKKLNTKTLALIGVMTAVTCILGPLSIPLPISPVPISLTNLAIYFSLYVLGMKKGTVSYLIYLLIGFIGLPVFSSFTSGPAKLLGPTGGYLIGFIFMALIGGFVIDRTGNVPVCFIGLVIATAVCYMFGTAWLAYQGGMTFYAALAAGVIPFIPGDLAKIVIAMLAGPQIRKRLRKAGLV